MGIPKLYRWLTERYPALNQVIREGELPRFDNLYLDLNGVIHNCSHPNDEDVHLRLSEEQIVHNIFRYIDFIFYMIKPKKIFFMAVDGVAPRAKMNQQRGRRFRSAQESVKREYEARKRGEDLPKTKLFDSNCITPGTDFMVRMHNHLQYYVTSKLSTDSLWKNVKVILSGHETPGEGEHKIMDFIRYSRSQPDYDPNTSHCIYGLDADLIMLALASHEPYFSLLREEIDFCINRKMKTKKKMTSFNPLAITCNFLQISLLRDFLDIEFSSLKEKLSFDYDLESIINDCILMGFMCGNDFIPNIPNFLINKNALLTLFNVYKDTLPKLDGYLNIDGKLNLSRFQVFVSNLAQVDMDKFAEVNADLKYLKSKSTRLNVNGKLNDKQLSFHSENQIYHSENEFGFEEEDDENYDEDEDEDEDANREEEFLSHKREYYRTKLMYNDVDADVFKEQAHCYVRALQWNLHYYYDGCVSWSWFYPHHYAPYISDVKDFQEIDLSFEMGEPFKPFEQLLGVLPVQSRECLPPQYHHLFTDESSPLKEFYPNSFELDLNGKQNNWEAVVVIPFIDEKKLRDAARDCERNLSEEDRSHNKHSPHLCYTYTPEKLEKMTSLLPDVFPTIVNNHAKCKEIDENFFRLPPHQIKKGLCKNLKLDLSRLFFPRLLGVNFTVDIGKHYLKVFDIVSKYENMLLRIELSPNIDINKVINDYMGKNVFINWPYLIEGKVVKISDFNDIYILKRDLIIKNELSTSDKNVLSSKVIHLCKTLKNKRGIEVGKVKIVCFVSLLKKSPTGPIKLNSEDIFSDADILSPLQLTLKDIEVINLEDKEDISPINLYPIGSKCFVLHDHFYGDMAEILEVKRDSKFKVLIFRKSEPDFSEVKEQAFLLSQSYMPNSVLAQRLALSSHMTSCLTGCVFVQSSDGKKINIGLDLKLRRTDQVVVGFSKKKGNIWLFSKKTLDVLEKYQNRYPELFKNLCNLLDRNDIRSEELFNCEDPDSKLAEVHDWLKEMPHSKAAKQQADAEILEQEIVKAVEEVLNYFMVFADLYTPVGIVLSSEYLYTSEAYPQGFPHLVTDFNLFDRVVNVRSGIQIPLGWKGVVIGKTKIKSHTTGLETTLLDIIFDEEFPDGTQVYCREFQMRSCDLINISSKKINGYGIQNKSLLEPLQPNNKIFDRRDASKINMTSELAEENLQIPFTKQRFNNSFTPYIQSYDAASARKSNIKSPSDTKKNRKAFKRTSIQSNHGMATPMAKQDVTYQNETLRNVWRYDPQLSCKDNFEKYCLIKFGKPPSYIKSHHDQMQNQIIVKLPDKTRKTIFVNSNLSEEQIQEECANKMLEITQAYTNQSPTWQSQDSSQQSDLILMPRPPSNWFTGGNLQNRSQNQTIHDNFIRENIQSFNKLTLRNIFTNKSNLKQQNQDLETRNVHKDIFRDSKDYSPGFDICTSRRNGRLFTNSKFNNNIAQKNICELTLAEGTTDYLSTGEYFKQKFTPSKIRNAMLKPNMQQKKLESPTKQHQTFDNKFVPLQVARANQTYRIRSNSNYDAKLKNSTSNSQTTSLGLPNEKEVTNKNTSINKNNTSVWPVKRSSRMSISFS